MEAIAETRSQLGVTVPSLAAAAVVGYAAQQKARTQMKVQCQKISSATKSWEALIEEATAFATSLGRDRLINISVAAAGGSDAFGVGARGTIFVWYWE